MIDEQLATSNQDTDIIAFIRSYDRDFQGQTNRRHNIIKAYTYKEMIRLIAMIFDQEMPLLTANISSFKSTLRKGSHAEYQLFTLSTKTILNGIADASTEFYRATSSTTIVKMNLFLTKGAPKAEPKMDTAARLKKSPTKKNKGKLKLS